MEPFHPEEDFGDETDSISAESSDSGVVDEENILPLHLQSPRVATPPASRKRPSSDRKSSLTSCFACGADPSLVLEPHTINSLMDHVVIIGAGAIGGLVGCCLYAAQSTTRLTFLVQDATQIERYVQTGLAAHSSSSCRFLFRARIPPHEIRRLFTTDPASCLPTATCILVATKRSANVEIHQRWLCHPDYHVECPVVFLQSGIHIAQDDLLDAKTVAGRILIQRYQVIESVVNITHVTCNSQTGIITAGQPIASAAIVLDGSQPSAQAVCDLFRTSALRVYLSEPTQSILSLQAGQLQLTLIHAINALSGGTMSETLINYGYRLALSHCVDECRAVFAAHQIPVVGMPGGLSDTRQLEYMSSVLKLWNMVFTSLMGVKLEWLQGKSSMAHDLDHGMKIDNNHHGMKIDNNHHGRSRRSGAANKVTRRKRNTEVDFINGAVVRLGRLGGVPTPINAKIVQLVHRAEAMRMGCPQMCSQVLLTELGLVKAGNNKTTTRKEARACRGADTSTNGVEPTMLLSFDSLRGTMTANSSSTSESDNSSWGPAPNPVYTSTSSSGSTAQTEYYSTGYGQKYSHHRDRFSEGLYPLATLSCEIDDLTYMASPPMSLASSSSSPTDTTAMSAVNRIDTVDGGSDDEEDLEERFDRNALWNY